MSMGAKTNQECRNDPHRRGTIQPEFYKFVGWYTLRALRGGRGAILKASIASWEGSEEAQDFKAMQYGDFGRCGVCGAHFVCGEVWQHDETKDMVHVGWECALKYRLVSGTDWTAIKAERDRAMKAERTKARHAKSREAMIARFPGLLEALAVDHHISRDLKFRFEANSTLTERQIALAFSLRVQVIARDAERARRAATEVRATAPTGRTKVRGVVISIKETESAFGPTTRMTVKVTTENGAIWFANGTVPTSLLVDRRVARGDEVEFTATLHAGNEPHFAFAKRPTSARIVKVAAAPVVKIAEGVVSATNPVKMAVAS